MACRKPLPVVWCEQPRRTNDGPFPLPGSCQQTATDIEGPYYVAGAPTRDDLDLYGDEGDLIEVSGRVYEPGCSQPLSDAIVEVWHANPGGEYDFSDQMRYRAAVAVGPDGVYRFVSLLPGRYLNGKAYRPRHIHVKVMVGGVERLTTQLYVAGDPYIECDPFARTSLVVPFVEAGGGLRVGEVDLVLS